MASRLYLDHAATTPMSAAARAAVADGWARWANPSSPHAEGRAARAALEGARAGIAAAYGWRHEVILTSGATEALGIALARAAVARRLVSAVEHDAVLRVCPQAEVLPVRPNGLLDLSSVRPELVEGRPTLARADWPSTGSGRTGGEAANLTVRAPALVCVQWANSETGVRQPIAAIAQAVHAAGNLLLVDAAQMPAGADPEVAAHADLVALSAHKRGGPPGIGALLVRDLATLSPTGGQERGYRPGTENLPGALGHAAALAEPEPIARWADLRVRLDDAIERSGGEIVGGASPRHPAIGSYRMPGVAAAAQLIRFDLAGIAVSAGSACSSGSMKPSHVLAAMGWREEQSREVIRISFGRDTGDADVDRAIAAWRDIARGARRLVAQEAM